MNGDHAAAAAIGSNSNVNAEEPQRILTLKKDAIEIEIPVAASLWTTAEHLWNAFQDDEASGLAGAKTSRIELLGAFLRFSLDYRSTDTSLSFLPLLRTLFAYFHAHYLRDNDIHAVVHTLEDDARTQLTKTYFLLVSRLRSSGLLLPEQYTPAASALFAAAKQGRVTLMSIFGGQGNVDDYFRELEYIFDVYGSIVEGILTRIAAELQRHVDSPEAKATGFFTKGMEIMQWLQQPETRPPLSYMVNAALSMPLIGLIQLLNYYVMMQVLQLTPREVRELFKATTGHSQGLVSAVVVATAKTTEEFADLAERAVLLLFWMGVRSQQAYPETTLNPKVLQDSLAHGEGEPTCMLAINHLSHSVVRDHVEATNQHLPEKRQLKISLLNGPRFVIVSGPPQSLYGLNMSLRRLKAKSSGDQSRIPHSQRNVKFSTRYLPVSVPFHSSYLRSVPELITQDIVRDGLVFKSKDMGIPVFSTDDGRNLLDGKYESDLAFTLSLVDQISHLPLDWQKATNCKVTHIIDFGPGGTSGVGNLTQRNKEGSGVQFLLGGSNLLRPSRVLLDKRYIFDSDPGAVQFAQDWSSEFAPSLVRTKADGKIHVYTRFSQIIGKPPLSVAGMTPTSVNEHFVAACINAGFHCEMGGGGHYSERAFRDRVQKIMEKVQPGEGITVNILFLNARQWGFQYPLSQQMRKDGFPIEGICVAAGTPSLDNANEIIANLQAAGIRHIAFKPGSIDSIRQVCTIAEHNPTMPIILQWTGGRAGGHHSYEDFHQPILQTYGLIRKQDNITLVAGSGMGDAKGSLPYLTGDWSLEFDYPPMPFDAILFASRLMVAKESQASDAAKQLIVDAPGVDNQLEWESSYTKPTGGVLTVLSELGEPIHKIANRGIRFWKEMDEMVFTLPREKRLKVLLEKKDYIIKRLNDDFQRVWFGRSISGKVVDLEEMTYYEVAHRMVVLMFVHHQTRWIDKSYRRLVLDFLERVEERFAAKQQISILHQLVDTTDLLDAAPIRFVDRFFESYPRAHEQLLTTEDTLHFIALCRRRGQKPVPFIPVFDENFDVWFKKDSLWQSEDLDAVVDQDPGRVCILQGPVAAKYSVKINEPIKDILGGIYEEYIQALLARFYDNNVEKIPTLEYLGAEVHRAPSLPQGVSLLDTQGDQDRVAYQITDSEKSLPEHEEWLQLLAGPRQSWIRALLTSSSIIQGKMLGDNTVRKLLAPKPSQRVVISYRKKSSVEDNKSERVVEALRLYDRSTLRNAKLADGVTESPALEILLLPTQTEGHATIQMNLYERKQSSVVSLPLLFTYHPQKPYNAIHEVLEGRNDRIKKFYWTLWFDEPFTEKSLGDAESSYITSEFVSTHTVQRKEITEFCRSVGNKAEIYVDSGQPQLKAPMDFAIVISWKAVMQCLFLKVIDADLLKLVHLSNEFKMESGELLQEDDVVETIADIRSIINESTGKTVEVRASLFRRGDPKPVIEVVSAFFCRGVFTDFEHTFRKITEIPIQVELRSNKDVAVLKSKPWILWSHDFSLEKYIVPGAVLKFRLESLHKFKNREIYSEIRTHGSITIQTSTKEIIQIGSVYFEGTECHGNPVMEYLNRVGKPVEQAVYFSNGGYSILPDPKVFSSETTTPTSNEQYAQISGDLNPIHVNWYFSTLASLPTTITHGMWTSASTRRFVEIFAADNEPRRVTAYKASFVDMVKPGEMLSTKMSHVGMRNGRKIINIQTLNEQGTAVLSGTAEVEQLVTAYVFTGQGSQEKGMGMDLYASSPVAREIWDRADRHFLDKYGFSILDIVRNNPLERTVYFGGPKGDQIRSNYMSMVYEIPTSDNEVKELPLFPSITETTDFYTFKSPTGLLNATQFTQPSLTLLQKAAFEDMLSRGLVQEGCCFAGHSLGEYAALASIGNVLPIESLVDVVFYRGMTMQVAVPRDAEGRSNYGMIAVNPSRVGNSFGELPLKSMVDFIGDACKGLLQIVNYNVENYQYVVAGELLLLDVLSLVLNTLKIKKINFEKMLRTTSLDEMRSQLDKIVKECVRASNAKSASNGGIVVLERGFATIPLAGIDVPFHSRFLLSGVAPFREYLLKRINPANVNVQVLASKYIPNLTAQPFQVTKDYVRLVHDQSGSPKLARILRNWKEPESAADMQKLGYAILVELLAYQFASPVRWIETQDHLFKTYGVERFVEIGPGPTLTGMAVRTLQMKYEAYDDAMTNRRQNLCYGKDRSAIYYEIDSAEPEVSPSKKETSSPAAAVPVAAPVAAPSFVPPVPSGPVSQVPDAPMAAEEAVHAIVATKLKRSLAEVPTSKNIKDLSAGKSTMQNEILGDLQKEFGAITVDKPDELSLKELAASLASSHSGSLGKYTSGQVSRMISSKMPGGFGLAAVKSYLSSTFGLGAGRTDSILLHALTMEPAARLGNPSEANAWWDSVVQSYSAKAGLSIGKGGASGGAMQAAAPMMIASPAVAAGGGAAASIPDAPPSPLEFVKVLVAAKLKKKVSEISDAKPIKDMVDGKSTLQNELLGDIQKEFEGSSESNAADLPIKELAQTLGGSYKQLGKHSKALINRMISSKMPGGFSMSAVRAHLASKGFGEGRQDSILLHSLTSEPANRLGNETEVKAWLDSVSADYAIVHGVSMAGGGPAGGAPMIMMQMPVDSKAITALQLRQDTMIREQMEIYARFIGKDLRYGYNLFESATKLNKELQQQLDLWGTEHGEQYENGIKPLFDSRKARLYDSYWNWAKQEAILLFFDIIFGKLTEVDREVTQRCIYLMNRSYSTLLDVFNYYMAMAKQKAVHFENYKRAYELGSILANNIKETLLLSPYWKNVAFPQAPHTIIDPSGEILYEEISRVGIRKLSHYVTEMQRGGKLTLTTNIDVTREHIRRLHRMLKGSRARDSRSKAAMRSLLSDILRSLQETPSSKRLGGARTPLGSPPNKGASQSVQEQIPYLHLKRPSVHRIGAWEYARDITAVYLDCLKDMAENGVSFHHKTALLTGCGKDSIGAEVLNGLLAGGARVVVTTSNFCKKTTEYYRGVYERHGGKDSFLVVVPFNQGSLKDVHALVDYIYGAPGKDASSGGLGWDLDIVMPFAAIPENGREITEIDGRSELAHRIMLINLIRLLGAIKAKKQQLGYDTRPAQVVLPLSPNHGTFGGDGLYSESKIALETLFNRWHSESWSTYLTVVGAVIGWTRGTGLMSANNMVAQNIEKLGVRTFSTQEMAFNILGLMHRTIAKMCQAEPVWADLNGGLQFVKDLNTTLTNIRLSIRETSDIRKAIVAEEKLDEKILSGATSSPVEKISPRANIQYPFPKLRRYEELLKLRTVKDTIDLSKVVVITGFGEVGPWGNSRTRWEMEAYGRFSLEGCIELAWIMGYIKHFHGELKDGPQKGRLYSGWVDAKTGEPVKDFDVKARYEQSILEHAGIRFIEPELFHGYDPNRKMLLQQVAIDHDMAPIEVSKEEAESFRFQHGDDAEIFQLDGDESGPWFVRLKKGATLYIPKALQFDRLVAGQIPTGWDASRYGIPKDIIDQVDPVTLYVLVATAEALVSSGISDPYEFYEYVHVSEVGNTSGGGVGGMHSTRQMYRDRFLDKPVAKDILQENFINTSPAWVNMLLLSSSGPIKTPVGACATAVESVEIGMETILTGKAKIVVVGGFDDFNEEGSYEFANMGATSNAVEELAKGREPREMSRPGTTSRAGFMESQGAGMQILMPADLALQMGVPIYGILALTNTATDKEGRSVPAPGQGILTTARERPASHTSCLLDVKYRERQISLHREKTKHWVENEYRFLHEEIELTKSSGTEVSDDWIKARSGEIEAEAARQEKTALAAWGHDFYTNNPNIAPLRGALAVWGLTIDDIGVASFHGTSTKANDFNESEVLNQQMRHLQRTAGNVLPAIMQKYLTGHPKGAAAAWMLNGVLQCLDSGVIPGNRNADNIEAHLRDFEYLYYPSRSIQTDGVRAGLLKSFGFGQVGGEVLVVHADYLLATLDESTYERYVARRNVRQRLAYRHLHDALTDRKTFIRLKTSPPYSEADQAKVYLDPLARATYDGRVGSWTFRSYQGPGSGGSSSSSSNLALPNSAAGSPAPTRRGSQTSPDVRDDGDAEKLSIVKAIMQQGLPTLANKEDRGVGVDIELLSAINLDNATFLERNFTEAERDYCQRAPDPRASFTGRWCAKEAVIKAVASAAPPDHGPVWKLGAGAPLRDIEVVFEASGAPAIRFHGDAIDVVKGAGVQSVRISITHSGAYAMAVAFCQ